MEQVEVKDCDRVLLRALDIPASNDALMSVASHRIEATRTTDQAKDEEIARMRECLEGLRDWFDTDEEILEAMDADTLADHNRQVARINAALGASNA